MLKSALGIAYDLESISPLLSNPDSNDMPF
jgi:hypothetical protein